MPLDHMSLCHPRYLSSQGSPQPASVAVDFREQMAVPVMSPGGNILLWGTKTAKPPGFRLTSTGSTDGAHGTWDTAMCPGHMSCCGPVTASAAAPELGPPFVGTAGPFTWQCGHLHGPLRGTDRPAVSRCSASSRVGEGQYHQCTAKWLVS